MRRLYVDFNSRDLMGNIFINICLPENSLLAAELKQKMIILIYDETLEVEAELAWNLDFQRWIGIANWDTAIDKFDLGKPKNR